MRTTKSHAIEAIELKWPKRNLEAWWATGAGISYTNKSKPGAPRTRRPGRSLVNQRILVSFDHNIIGLIRILIRSPGFAGRGRRVAISRLGLGRGVRIAVNFTHRAGRVRVCFLGLSGGARRSPLVPGSRAATTAQAKVFQSLLSSLLELTGFSLDQVLGVPDLVLNAVFLGCCKFPWEVKLGAVVSVRGRKQDASPSPREGGS